MKRAPAKLTMAQLSLDDLLLDPNNPRFVEDLDLKDEAPDEKVEALQDEALKRFRTKADEDREGDDESFFGVHDLIESMSQIGFVSIDRVVVRKLDAKKATKS